jgi:hypothetical protein
MKRLAEIKGSLRRFILFVHSIYNPHLVGSRFMQENTRSPGRTESSLVERLQRQVELHCRRKVGEKKLSKALRSKKRGRGA